METKPNNNRLQKKVAVIKALANGKLTFEDAGQIGLDKLFAYNIQTQYESRHNTSKPIEQAERDEKGYILGQEQRRLLKRMLTAEGDELQKVEKQLNQMFCRKVINLIVPTESDKAKLEAFFKGDSLPG